MINWYIWSRVLLVSLSGFAFGYDVGAMSGVMDLQDYRSTLNVSLSPSDSNSNDTAGSCNSEDDVGTAAILGLVVSLLSVGCLVGALIAGFFSEFLGRKPAVILGASLLSCSGIIHVASVNLWMVLLSRIIGGLGIGVLYQATPIYVAEISPENLRGKLLSLFTIYATAGTVIGTVVNISIKNIVFGWRISVGIQFVVGTVLALGMLLLPRSPRWLAKNHREEEALKVLTKIYRDPNRAQDQLDEIASAVSSTKEPFLATLKFISRWNILQRLLIGFFLFFIGRLTGLNFIVYFSVSILCGVGLPGFAVSIPVAVVGFASVFLSMAFIDKLGRKPLLMMGMVVMLVTDIAAATTILAFDLENGAAGGLNASQKVAGYFVLIFVCIFLVGANMSIGSVPWVIIGEMFPLKGRGFMVAVCSSGFWAGLLVINQVSSILIRSSLHISGTFFLFAAVTFFLTLYVLLLLPETKGLTLEKVDELFSKPWKERLDVLKYLRCGCFWDQISVRGGRGDNYQLLQVPVMEPSEDREHEDQEDPTTESDIDNHSTVNVT